MTTSAHSTESILADADFPALKDYIIAATGLEYFGSRPQALARHVAERLRSRRINLCREYWNLLVDPYLGEAEMDQLIALLTIGETYFFRHRELYDALKEAALPAIIERNRATKRLRIWSAGCSTGPEAYSISILLRRELAELTQGWSISIVGTDINRSFLSQAAEGRYDEWAFRGTPPELRRECFVESQDGWLIAPQFRQGVSFEYHNLARHPLPSLIHNLVAFDLILCRNVLIYFAPDFASTIASKLADCLVTSGWLAVGHAEHSVPLRASFEAVNYPGATLYYKSIPCGAVPTDLTPRLSIGSHHRAASHSAASDTENQACNLSTTTISDRDSNQNVRLSSPCSVQRRTRTTCSEIEQIRKLADEGQLRAAKRICEDMIAKNRLSAIGYYYHALFLEQIEGSGAALGALSKAIYLKRDFHLAHYYKGLTEKKLGHVADAAKSFRNVLSILETLDRSECIPDAEGMTVADLDELTRIHLESLNAA